MTVLQQETRILVIEDNTGDFVLIEEYLLEETKQLEIERAVTLSDFKDIFGSSEPFDAILLDLTLPDASGESLVDEVVSLAQDTPVIVLTGYENREFGLKTLGMGISDYLLKDELNPFLLSKSISYSMERNRINRSLRESEKQYRDLFDLSPIPKWVFDLETMEFLDVNLAAMNQYGYSREEFLAMTIQDIRPERDLPALEKARDKFADAKGPHHIGLFTHQKKNGELIKVEIQSSKIDYNGRPAKMVIAHDVTEQKENEAELVDLNKKLSTAQQIAKLGYWEMNVKTKEIYWSGQTYKIFGMNADEHTIDFQTVLNHFHPDDYEYAVEQTEQAIQNRESLKIEHRIVLSDESVKWIQVIGYFEDRANEGVVIEGTVQDITEKVENEQKLQESLERYEYVTKATDEVIYDWDIEADELKWDDSFYSKFPSGSKDEQYTIEDWSKNLYPEERDEVRKILNEALMDPVRNKWELEYRFRKNNGSYAIVFERGFILRDQEGKAIRMIGSLQDITERKEYEEKLEQLSLVASKTTDVIIITDAEERITWVNSAFEKLTGYTFEEALGENPGELLQGPDTDPDTVEHLAKAMENCVSVQAVILNYTKKGEPYWLDITIDPIFDEEGKCEAFIAIEKDVTEQIKRQKRLRESVDRYETVSKATSDTIWDLDLVNDRTFYNENITEVFGYEKQQVNEPWQWWKSKIHPEDRLNVVKAVEEALEKRQERIQFEYRFQAADGTYKNVYDRAFIVTDDEGKPIRMIGAMQDVTRQKEGEVKLKESLKEKETLLLEIHHRVKNNLAVVSGMMQLQAFEEDDEKIKHKLYDSISRIKTMGSIHELLYRSESFSKLDLDKNIEKLVNEIIETYGIDFTLDTDFELDNVNLNINQAIPFSLIINEVVTNALKHGFNGRKHGSLFVSLTEEDKQIHCRITDNGEGLPEDFSTSKESKSLGMQLISTLSNQLGAEYSYETVDGETSFTLQFRKTDVKGASNALLK